MQTYIFTVEYTIGIMLFLLNMEIILEDRLLLNKVALSKSVYYFLLIVTLNKI